jgi:plastocyanin
MKIALSLVLIMIGALVFGCAPLENKKSEPGVVIIKAELLQFAPEEVTVKAGTTIRWLNGDNVDHDVTSGISITGREARGKKKTKTPDGKFQSGLFSKGKTFEITLDEKGVYPYYCNTHPFMVGRIVVE